MSYRDQQLEKAAIYRHPEIPTPKPGPCLSVEPCISATATVVTQPEPRVYPQLRLVDEHVQYVEADEPPVAVKREPSRIVAGVGAPLLPETKNPFLDSEHAS